MSNDAFVLARELNLLELFDLRNHIDGLIERKQNEDKVSLLVVYDDTMTFGYFRMDDMKGALEYCLSKFDSMYPGLHIVETKVRESEVEEKLAFRW